MLVVLLKKDLAKKVLGINGIKALSSQMLSKQDPKFAQQQLDLTYERRRKEFDEINSLTNPTVRKDLLISLLMKPILQL